MPLLAEYAEKIGSRHLSGIRVLYINHMISDALMTAAALKKAGAEMSIVGIPYGSTDSGERRWVIDEYNKLGNFRFPVVENVQEFRALMRQCVLEALAEIQTGAGDFMIVEDGGYAFPLLHDGNHEQILDACIGGVEHTARGMWNYQFMEVDATPVTPRVLRKPAITVANSKLKSAHEPLFVAHAVVHEFVSVLTRNHEFLPFQQVAVLGNGRIGKPIATLLRTLGATVEAVDPRPQNAQANVHTALTQALFSSSRFFMGASGTPSVSYDQLMEFLRNDPNGGDKIFASASSKNIEFTEVIRALDILTVDRNVRDQVLGSDRSMTKENIPEFGLQYTLNGQGSTRKFSILGEGYPIIFYPRHTHGAPSKPFDPVMTQLFLAACTMRSKYIELENRVYSLDEVRQACVDNDDLATLLDDKILLRRWCELNGLDSASYFQHIKYE